MQYAITGSRKQVAPEVAKAWFKAPSDFKLKPLVSHKNIITFNGNTVPLLLEENGRTLQIKKLFLKYIGKSKYDKAFKPRVCIEQSIAKSYTYNIDQLSGKLLPLNRLRYERIYDKLALIANTMPVDHIYIEDKEQWIRESDISKLGIVTYVGSKKRYVSSYDWLISHETVELSTHEGRYILRSESNQVIVAWDGENVTKVRVSKYAIANNEFGRYNHCRSCNSLMLSTLEVDRRCPICNSGRAEAPRSGGPRGDIYNYTYKVEKDLGFDAEGCEHILHLIHPKTKPAVPVYLGLELEYNVKDGSMNTSAKFVNNTKYALCKSDSSIGGGYEIVSKPCSIATHRKNLKTILDKHGKDYIAGSTCGIHVHVSRDPFTESDIAKALSFLHREANRDFIKAIARRDSHRYARLTDTYIKQNKANPRALKNGTVHKLLTNQDHGSPGRERYTALNIGDKTLEFRIFAASTDLDTIIASAQFCEAVCLYAKAHTTSAKYSKLPVMQWLNIANFIQFLKDSQVKTIVKPATDREGPVHEVKQKYPELEAFIITNKLPTSSKNSDEVLYTKVYNSIINNVLPITGHRMIPVTIAETIAKGLLLDKTIMLRWLHEISDERGGQVVFNEDSKMWDLRTYDRKVLWSENNVTELRKEVI